VGCGQLFCPLAAAHFLGCSPVPVCLVAVTLGLCQVLPHFMNPYGHAQLGLFTPAADACCLVPCCVVLCHAVCAGKALEAAGAKSLGGLILEHLDGLKAAG
jgi:hypothetical protein